VNAPGSANGGANGADRSALRGILEPELLRLAPGLEVVDRGLVLATRSASSPAARLADLVLADGQVSLVFALIVDGSVEGTILAAVDALLFARENADAMVRGPRRGETRARVALIAEGFSESCLDALELLPADELWILEAKRFESASGVRMVLVSRTPPPAMAAPIDPEREAFLERLPDPVREVAESLLLRLTRAGGELRTTFADDRATVRSGGREICSLEVQDGQLRADARALANPRRIDHPADAEAFLDEVIRSELSATEREEEGGPLLTPEEIAAFHD
jgi:hypothetical protein